MYIYIHIFIYIYITRESSPGSYEMATISSLPTNIGLYCKKAL